MSDLVAFLILAVLWGAGWAFWLGTVMYRFQFMHRVQGAPVAYLVLFAISGLGLWPFWLGEQHAVPSKRDPSLARFRKLATRLRHQRLPADSVGIPPRRW